MYKTQDHFKINQKLIPVTSQMIREAVEVIQMRKLFVNTELIIDYLIKHYPVDNKTLTTEIIPKLKYAVRVGLIAKCGHDQFCIPTLLQDANTMETAFNTF
ncbi:uncharacterized protein LOC118451151 [Vespa mandarinia]|uniref:uncharacterized protein LOC118451151 n=1 Tax=Vespa mandarinia TaxID=7446 RepID=UPI00160A36A9|nr:uncharacterized protein LOC118451151 [Vespa mandarinia]